MFSLTKSLVKTNLEYGRSIMIKKNNLVLRFPSTRMDYYTDTEGDSLGRKLNGPNY